MEKLEKKKYKTNNMAHLVSLAAIVALILCLGLVVCIRAVINRGNDNSDAELAKMLQNEDGEEMAGRLEEVQKNLETLESAVNDSTSTINTLYKTQDENKKTQLDEYLTQLKSIEERLTSLKSNVSTLMETVNSNEEYDTSVMIENFVKLYSDVDKLKENLDDVLNNILSESGENTEQILKVMDTMQNKFSSNMSSMEDKVTGNMNSMENKLTSNMNSMEDKVNGNMSSMENKLTTNMTSLEDKLSGNITTMESNFTTNMTTLKTEFNNNITKTNDDINKSIEDSRTSLETTIQNNDTGLRDYLDAFMATVAGRFDKVDSDIDSVFQYVANGKRGLASSLATIGTPVDIDVESGQYNIESFETLMDKIAHSQDISGTYEEGENSIDLSGALANNLTKGKAAWVCGQYVVGNGADVDEAYNQGYGKGYAEGLEKANSANVLYTLGHVHTGGTTSSTARNGCYQSTYEYHTYTTTMHETCTGEDGTSQYCSVCGATLSVYGGITWGVPGCQPHQTGGYQWVGHLVCGLSEGEEVRQTTDLSDMTSNEKILRAEISFP